MFSVRPNRPFIAHVLYQPTNRTLMLEYPVPTRNLFLFWISLSLGLVCLVTSDLKKQAIQDKLEDVGFNDSIVGYDLKGFYAQLLKQCRAN